MNCLAGRAMPENGNHRCVDDLRTTRLHKLHRQHQHHNDANIVQHCLPVHAQRQKLGLKSGIPTSGNNKPVISLQIPLKTTYSKQHIMTSIISESLLS